MKENLLLSVSVSTLYTLTLTCLIDWVAALVGTTYQVKVL